MTTSVTFTSAVSVTVSSGVRSVVAGDFNGDGKKDLAVANGSDGTVTVLLSNGSGSFSSSSFSVSVCSPAFRSIAVGDFNGDGKQDLVLAGRDYASAFVFLGNGSGGFSSSSYFSVGCSPYFVAVGDFNGDGKQDLVSANRGDNSVTVLLGNGAGSFSFSNSTPVGSSPYFIAVDDFNGDGKKDLAVANRGESTISVLLGNGSGGFGSNTSITVGTAPRSIAVGDFNKDGKKDLAVANSDSNNVSILLGNGSGGFSTAVNYSVGSTPRSVVVGDFNGDGKLDLATANADSNNVSLLLGNGSGSFGTATNFNVGTSPYYLTVGDFNGDKKPDLVTANESGGDISLLSNTSIFPNKFTNSKDDIFQIGGDELTTIKIKIKIKGRGSKLVNELGVFNVDDDKGTIDGVAPGAAGYQEKALERGKIIFSVIANNPTGFSPDDLSRILEFQGGTQLRFYLKSQSTIIFSSTTTQQITTLETGGFTIGWKDGSRGDSAFDDLLVSVAETDEDSPIGTGLQGDDEGEVIDCRDFSSDTLISGSFTVNREASYTNYVGFYQVSDEEGGIDTNGDGTVDILPGQAGYLQAAINARLTDIGLSVGNQGRGSHNSNFKGGGIYVPFLIVNGGVDALLDSNSSNDPTVYFTFLGANTDKAKHVKILGDNTFGFEDLSGGGDKDYNDVIVKINLTVQNVA
jgi:FG-GAP-like repeat/Domain of unknown function (DUF4114)